MNYTPKPHQKKIIEFIDTNPKAFIIVDMGLGKTAATLQALERLYDAFMVSKVLIVAPLRVCSHVWTQEIKKWGFSFSYSMVLGSAQKRKQAIAQEAQLYIINRENIAWLVSSVKKSAWKWDTLIIDESSSFKSQRSKRFKALKRTIKAFNRVVLLTGTPTSNGLLEIWPQMYFLDSGESLETSFTRFRNKYFVPDYMGYNWTVTPSGERKIHEAVKKYSLTLKAKDYLNLPPRQDINVYIDMPKDLREEYRELKKEYILDLKGQSITAANAAVLSNKLQQFCQGYLYNEALEAVFIHNLKLEALKELLEQIGNNNVIIAYNYVFSRELLLNSLPGSVDISKDGAIEAWDQGRIKIMLAHPKSAGHGLNLQHGGNHIIWYGLTWSLELWQQFNARLEREGQTKKVIIHRIIITGTVEEKIIEALDNKKSIQDALIDYLKLSN